MSWMYGLSLLASSGINAWQAGKNRQSSEKISSLNRDSSEEVALLSRKHSAELQYNQIKFSILQQRENQDFQKELAELSHERIKEIEVFRAEVNFAINQKNLDFQKWSFEQRKKIELEILQLQQDFQRDLARLQHQNAVELMRERLRSDKSPIHNQAFDLLENSFAHRVMPLQVLISPPQLNYDPKTGKPYLSGFEDTLAEEIHQFLRQGYAGNQGWPVQFLDGNWISNSQGGNAALLSLHSQLKSIPVLILDTKVPLEELNFSVGYWFSGDASFTRSSILSGQSFSDLLYESAKKRALQWEKKREKIKASGKDEAYIKALGKVDEENLQIYYQELAEIAELKQTGVTDLPIRKKYIITEEDYKTFYRYLAVWHCLTIGLYADILFLGNSWENTPLLPSLIPYLLEKYRDNPLLTSEFWQEAISSIVKVYGKFYDSLKSNFAYCAPEIRMKLALSLSNLHGEYKYLALEQGNKAFSDWLEVNGVPVDKIFDVNNDDDCQVLKRIIYQENKPFLDLLKSLLEKIQGEEGIDGSKTTRIGSLLVGWEFLSCLGGTSALPVIGTEKLPAIMETNPKKSDRISQTTIRKKLMSNRNSSNPLQNLKVLFQNRPEVLKMLDARELDLAGLESEAYIREQKKRKLYPEPVNFYATGRTGAGKTSLGNTLLDSGSPMKSTGHQDCTSSVQYFALASNLRYFDLPGAGSNEQFENINRGALLIEQITDEDEEIYPVKALRILDFSEYETKGFKEELVAVEKWQSKENQKNVSADVILYVVAPHMMFIGDDKRYLKALLKSQKQQNQKIIFALNIHRTKDGTSIIPTPQNLEDARKIITEIYQKFYPNTIPLIVEIDSLKGTGVSEITELICQILPSEKIGNMQQALKDELKEVAKKERSYRYRQTLISIASRLATERVDTPLGKGILSEAYAAVCSYGISIFVEEDARVEMEKAVYELVDEYAAQTKMSRARVIEVMTKDVQEKEVTTEKISGYIPEYEDFSITDEIPDYHEETIKVKRSAIERGGLGLVEGVVQVVASPISLIQGIVSAFGGMKEEDIVVNKIHQEFDRDAYKNENVIKAGTRKVTRIEQRFKGMKEQKQTVTEKIPYAVEKMQKVGEKFIQGGYPVVENLLAIGLGIESADLSVDLSQNFEQVVELGQKQVKTALSRYEAKINQLAESNDPDLAEAEIIKILEGALLK